MRSEYGNVVCRGYVGIIVTYSPLRTSKLILAMCHVQASQCLFLRDEGQITFRVPCVNITAMGHEGLGRVYSIFLLGTHGPTLRA